MTQQTKNNVDNAPKKPFWEKGEKSQFIIFSLLTSLVWMKYADNLILIYKRAKPLGNSFSDTIYFSCTYFGYDFLSLISFYFFNTGAITFCLVYWLSKQIFKKIFWVKLLSLFFIIFMVNFIMGSVQCIHPDLSKFCSSNNIFLGGLSKAFNGFIIMVGFGIFYLIVYRLTIYLISLIILAIKKFLPRE